MTALDALHDRLSTLEARAREMQREAAAALALLPALSMTPMPVPLVVQPAMSDRCLTAAEVAARLGVSRSQLYRLVKRGDLRMVTVGDSRRVMESELRDYLARAPSPPPLRVIRPAR